MKNNLDESELGKNGPNQILKNGCYRMKYVPAVPAKEVLFYEGTLRVMRVNAKGEADENGQIKAGGDLYCRLRDTPEGRSKDVWKSDPELPLNQETGEQIPIFARSDYRYYLEVTQILEVSDHGPNQQGFTARFKVHQYDRNTNWPNPGTRTILMKRTDKDSERPSFFGKLMNEESGQVVGTIKMQWVSRYLRRGHILVDRVETVKLPCSQPEWSKAFEEAGWSMKVTERTVVLKGGGPAKGEWTVSQLHNAMLQAKEKFRQARELERERAAKLLSAGEEGSENRAAQEKSELDLKAPLPWVNPKETDLLDQEWLYHLFCVEDIKDFPRGVMYDTYGIDSNNVPREGAAIGCKWKFEDEARWGKARSRGENFFRLEDFPLPLRRVAVHEIGHAMGLEHNHQDNGYMNTTDAIAEAGLEKCKTEIAKAESEYEKELLREALALTQSTLLLKTEYSQGDFSEEARKARNRIQITEKKLRNATASAEDGKFPTNIGESFHPKDLDRLRFGPDVTVRPGGEFDEGGPYFDKRMLEAPGVNLEVRPLLEAVPLGAPVRVQLTLTNTSEKARVLPADISLNSGCVYGCVTDPEGTRRTFWPLKKCVDLEVTKEMQPKEKAGSSLTLLRGAQGALFPRSGRYLIKVTASWEQGDANLSVSGETEVEITPPADEAHRAAALKILATPDTLLSLAIGGWHLDEGREAIGTALGNEVLGPHFAIIEIKEEAALGQINERLCHEASVLSFSEIERIITLLEGAKSEERIPREAVARLEKKLRKACSDRAKYTSLLDRIKKFEDMELTTGPGIT